MNIFGKTWLGAFAAASAFWAVPQSVAEESSKEDWRPFAASYQQMQFMADLKPVPWEKISAAFNEDLPATPEHKSGLEHLHEMLGKNAPQLILEIEGAIANKDKQALYESLSKALVLSIDTQLNSLGKGEAEQIQTARQLYRAVEEFVVFSDAQTALKLSTLWDALGTKKGKGAKEDILAYLHSNYAPQAFASRAFNTPIPESSLSTFNAKMLPIWIPAGSNLEDQNPLPLLTLNFEEKGIDEADVPLIAYGDMLFDSPMIFGEVAQELGVSCSTCHNRSDVNRDFFIPGVSARPGGADVDGGFFNGHFNDFRDDAVDTPSLRGIRFTAPYGRNGRTASLREFTRDVIVLEFGGQEPSQFVLDALVAYQNEFDFLPNSKINRFGQLVDRNDASAVRGEELFNKAFAQMGGKSCSSCHVPSTNFTDNRIYDIGSETGGYEGSRGEQFETPTLINVAFTAPYFHDGSLPTLASVVEWFDKEYALGLDRQQKADLSAYITAIGSADEPYEVFEGKNTPFALAFAELTTFASTLELLIPTQDTFHANLMLDTVIGDLREEAIELTNKPMAPHVDALVKSLEAVQDSVHASNWQAAAAHFEDFKTIKKAHAAEMY
ncbi:cytochrome c peroxidase [Flexibacterium corallicola]|uniref:cytochrome c peroxidase n=1 Tax=Flexibacterium corallicola TaxID=3037259 RepID=UPI00286EF6B4|nr:cytochrome c peroxidase [Pseudovibrio sp. M1P-2-3]